MYDIRDWTYGVELEYGNCDRTIPQLPDGASWNSLDNTCVSSTGIANDPTGKLYKYGGEINTRPTQRIFEQVEHISLVNKYLAENGPAPIVNYRSNLHIHIRVPGLKDDLPTLKKLLAHIHRYQQEAFDIVETIPVPDINSLSPEEYVWARKRQLRRHTSHQHKLSQTRVDAMLAAETPEEFWHEHAHKNAKGQPAWFQTPRAGINLRQLFEATNTIEFRHFPGTLNSDEMAYSIEWCRDFLDDALNHGFGPAGYASKYKDKFQDFAPYEFYTEQVYQYTNFSSHSRKVVNERLTNLRKHINIDDLNTSSKDVWEVIMKLENFQEDGIERFFL